MLKKQTSFTELIFFSFFFKHLQYIFVKSVKLSVKDSLTYPKFFWLNSINEKVQGMAKKRVPTIAKFPLNQSL